MPSLGSIRLDKRAFTVTVDNQPVPLTRVEFDILAHILRHTGRVVSYDEIVQRVLRGVYRADSSVIRVHLAHLRKKLGQAARTIETIRGRGLLVRRARP
jgi:DNA-binding response OmpR family regulator